MIDEDRTMQLYGYTSDELSKGSGKRVIAVCDECGKYRDLEKKGYRDLCVSCTKKGENHPMWGKHRTEETNKKQSESMMGKNVGYRPSEETRRKLSEAHKGKILSEETRRKLSEAKMGVKPTEDHRRRTSAAKQGIPLSEWAGYVTATPYCEKFNESCRERNREKYGRRCFLCGKDETNNGRKLSVHHVDMNKDQGCDDHEWSLVPLCAACHGKAHNPVWQARIEYLITETFK